jgi:hypothetical protein
MNKNGEEIMCSIIFAEEQNNSNYKPSINKTFSIIEIEDMLLKDVKELLSFVKKGSVVKINEKDDSDKMKLYEFITPENFVLSVQKPNFMVSMKLMQYLVRNWERTCSDEFSVHYINRAKELFKPLL